MKPDLRMPSAPVLLLPLVILITLLAAAGAIGQTGTFAEVLRRAQAYVADYEDHALSTVIARERYHQQLIGEDGTVIRERTLLSDYLLLQLPDEDWVAVRDIYEVDGTTVTDRAARLTMLFDGPREQLSDRVMKLAEETAAFNLGDQYKRTLNLPTFALRILRPANRKRVEFEPVSEEQVDGIAAWVIAFEEKKGPTLTATRKGADVPAHGRFWIAPQEGTVLRSEMIVGGTRQIAARATITVTYARDPSLGFWLPSEMHERYEMPRRKQDGIVIALATYSDFRRFDSRSLSRRGSGRLVPAW
jgi:hypothetical protein